MNDLNKFLIILAMTIMSCSEATSLDSDEVNTAEERVEILKQEVRCFSDIKDAEFELFNVNGFKNSRVLFVPGASSSDYKFVVKVDTADISKWREGMTPFDAEHYDHSWIKEIVKNRKEDWHTTSKPTYYVREGLADGWNTTLVEFYSEGIVFKRVITN